MFSMNHRRRLSSAARRSRRAPCLEQLETRALLSTLGQIGGAAGSAYTVGTQAMDVDGNTYLSGNFTGTVDFDPRSDFVVERTCDDSLDTFVAKYNSLGVLSWVRQIRTDAYANGVTLDPAGVPHVYGQFTGTTDFGSENILVSAGGNKAPFVLKMDPVNGNTIWARTGGIGGGGSSSPNGWEVVGVSVGADGSVFSTGRFSQQTDFDPSRTYPNNSDILTATGWTTSRKDRTNYTTDAFVWKLDSAGSFVSVFKVGGTTPDQGTRISVDVAADGNGSLYLAMPFTGTADFDPGTGIANRTSAGSYELGYAKYTVTPTSTSLAWAQSIGGSGSDGDFNMGADSQYLYLAGSFSSAVDVDPSSAKRTLTPDAAGSAAIAKYRKSNGGLEWAGQFNGPGQTYPLANIIADQATGMVYLGGGFDQTMNFVDPQGVSSTPLLNAGMNDGFVIKLNSLGTYQEAWRMGGSGYDRARVVGVYGGAVVIAGRFEGTANFPTGGSLTDLGGGADAFLLALDQPAPLLAAAVPTKSIDQSLTVSQYQPIVAEAQRRWQAAGVNTAALSGINVQVRNLGGTTLGLASGNTMWLDDNAAGWGWFVDSTPGNSSEFSRAGNQGERNRMDLLTVVMHEMGHLLGQEHDDEGVMAETLATGIRRTEIPAAQSALLDQVFSQLNDRDLDLFGVLLSGHR